MDALRGTPVARALVHMNARAVLTDAQGRFSFPQFTDAQAFASVNKPGYTPSSDGSDGPAMLKVPDLDASVELKLYPDGIILGTVAARDGTPLPGVMVQLSRLTFQSSGVDSLGVRQVAATITDLHGSYRFREAAGRYRVETRSSSTIAQTGEMLLPAAFPAVSSGVASGFFSLSGGQERRVNLTPETGMPAHLRVRLDGSDADSRDEHRGGFAFTAVTDAGLPFFVPAEQEAPGLYRIALLPGTYQLKVAFGNREDPLEGSARVTLTRRDSQEVSIHLAEAPLLPIELSATLSNQVSAAKTQSNELPNISQFNLQLQNVESASGSNAFVRPRQTADGGYAFRAPAGRYHLIGSSSGPWSVTSAFYGSTDLAGGEIDVAGGSGGAPIRLVVSNASGQVTGTVRMGAASSAWLYMFPRTPGLQFFYVERLGGNGTFSQQLPTGSYTMVAVENQLQADLHDPRVARALATQGKQADVTQGSQTQLELTLSAGIPAPGSGSNAAGDEF